MKELILIAAVAQNNVIGYKRKIPWHIPEDLKRFRQLTLDHSIVMGRRTYESIGKPLDRRRNLVLTKDPKFKSNGITVCHSLEEALEQCKDEEQVYVIGGEKVYKEAILLATKLEITHINKRYRGDAFFPEIERVAWFPKRDKIIHGNGYQFVTYEGIPF